MKQRKKHFVYPLLLTAFTAILLRLTVPGGMLFGSEDDWYTQHVAIAEQFRQMFYETGNLFGQFSNLGGGSSIYDFAYYGFLRPDVLFSYLVPGLDMKYIISGYSLLCIFLSVNLCFFWLKRQRIPGFFSAAGSMLLVCATCFFQAHRQIMFINYMPFLLLALWGVDRILEREKTSRTGLTGIFDHFCRHTGLLTFSLCMFYIHSFYYSISCLFVVLIYFLYKSKGKRPLGAFIYSVGLSIGMACILLLPVGLNILSTEKDAGSFQSLSDILTVRPSLDYLLYGSYGCGLTLLALYCLLTGLFNRKTRVFSALLLLCPLLSVVPYLLNATLYVRGKSLMPLVPLIVLLMAQIMAEIYEEKQMPRIFPALLCFLPALFSEWRLLILADGFLLLLWVFALRRPAQTALPRYIICLSALLVPFLVSIGVGKSEEFLPADDTRQLLSASSGDEKAGSYSQQELSDFCRDRRYRFDCLTNPLVNSNALVSGEVQRTSMYSSITNSKYAHFYYDTMRNPISIRNRVALLPNSNCFFSYLMGVRYIQTTPGKIPYGYEVKAKKDGIVLAENTDTLPLAYGTGELLSETAFGKLSFPDTLEALTSKTVVPGAEAAADVQPGSRDTINLTPDESFSSHIQEESPYELLASADGLDFDLVAMMQSAQGLEVSIKGEQNMTLPLAKPLKDKILILNFQIESPEGNEVSVLINGIRNKLSAVTAAYPNNHHDFTYILSSSKAIDKLKVVLTEGDYTIKQLRVYSMDAAWLHHEDITEFQFDETRGSQVLNGTINMKDDGYFVTSLPYRNGYQAFVDGQEADVETVNTAFVGLPIKAGEHEIQLIYNAPGRSLAASVSALSLLTFLAVITIERRKHG